jgi:hypothetical protein
MIYPKGDNGQPQIQERLLLSQKVVGEARPSFWYSFTRSVFSTLILAFVEAARYPAWYRDLFYLLTLIPDLQLTKPKKIEVND